MKLIHLVMLTTTEQLVEPSYCFVVATRSAVKISGDQLRLSSDNVDINNYSLTVLVARTFQTESVSYHEIRE